jgi:hypothetical protein
VSTLYVQLLRAAGGREPAGWRHHSRGGTLGEVLRCRARLGVGAPTPVGSAPAAVADQLAYDLALLRLAGRLGIPVDVRRFAQAQKERVRLEGELADWGIRLADLDPGADPGGASPRES